jgi:hypothetical protein
MLSGAAQERIDIDVYRDQLGHHLSEAREQAI